MRHNEDGEMAGAWLRRQMPERRETRGDVLLARFDATQDVLLAAVALDRTRGPLTSAEHDAKAEELAAACRRYLSAHEAVKAGGR